MCRNQNKVSNATKFSKIDRKSKIIPWTYVEVHPISGFSHRSRESNSIFQWSKLLVPLCIAFFDGRQIRTRRDVMCSSGTPMILVKSFCELKKIFRWSKFVSHDKIFLQKNEKHTAKTFLKVQTLQCAYLFGDGNIFPLIFSLSQSLFIAQNVGVIYDGCFLEFGCIVDIIGWHLIDFLAETSNSNSEIKHTSKGSFLSATTTKHFTDCWLNTKSTLLHFVFTEYFQHFFHFSIMLTVELRLLVEFGVILLRTSFPLPNSSWRKINIAGSRIYVRAHNITLTFQCVVSVVHETAWACAWFSTFDMSKKWVRIVERHFLSYE